MRRQWHCPKLSAAKSCIPPSCLTIRSSVSKGFTARRCVTSSKMNHAFHPHLMALQRAGRQILSPPRLLPALFTKILQLSFFWKPEMLVQRACETPLFSQGCILHCDYYLERSLCAHYLSLLFLPWWSWFCLQPPNLSSPLHSSAFKIANLERWKK